MERSGRMRRGTGHGRPALLALVMALALAMVPGCLPARPVAAAQTFVVNATADPGSGGCTAAECSLREAISAANATLGNDTIRLNIPGSGPHTIFLTAELPGITDAVTIDGYSEPGAKEDTLARGTNARLMIELSGADAGFNSFGVPAFADNIVLRGLVINDFSNSGVVFTRNGLKIEGCFIGTDVSGTDARGNSRGVLSGTSFPPINFTVGGTAPAARNILSGNRFGGLSTNARNAVVQGNLVGTDRTGTKPLDNGGSGVQILDMTAANSTVSGNVVAFNDGVGIRVGGANTTGVRILNNSVFANGQEGINGKEGIGLGFDGPTANDPGDADTGENNLQNFPVLSSATSANGRVTVEGALDSTPNTSFAIQLFGNPRATGAEGKTFLREAAVRTDRDGRATFVVVVPKGKRVRPGQAITATATNLATGDTSEFSRPRPVRPETARTPAGAAEPESRPSPADATPEVPASPS